MKKSIAVVIFALFYQVLGVYSASALPVFARKYRTSCTTCHIAIFKRNAFGDAFRKNGYRMPEDDSFFVKEKPVSLGADSWKKMFPNAIWPGTLPGTLPIAFYGHERATWKGGQWELDTPHELSMLIGGVWGENISFFGEWLAWEEDESGRDRLVSFEIQFNDIFMEDVFNIKIGKHEIMAIDSFKEDNRLTLEHYNTWDRKVDGGSKLRTTQPGIVANGIVAKRFEYSVGMVNGSNKDGNAGNTLEDNNDKDYYGRIAFKLGGMPLTGPEMGDNLATKDNWRDDSIQVAGFGYLGTPVTENFSTYGVSLRGLYSIYDLGATWVTSSVDNPGGSDKKMNAWFAEGQARVFPWMLCVVRYEAENFKTGSVSTNHDARWIFNLTMLQRANLRWTLEQVYYPRSGPGEDGTNSFKVNLLFAF